MDQICSYIALDLGAESGRVIIGRLDGERLQLEMIHRFPNGPVQVFDSLYWDILYLWREMKEGLKHCVQAHGSLFSSLGVDSWALDFVLLGADDVLLGNPYYYRDGRTEGMIEEVLKHVTLEEVYQTTGNVLHQFSTLCQLLSMVKANSPALQVARTFLTIPDLFNFWLTGRKVCESSHVINTQCYNPVAQTWAANLLDKLNIPASIFPEVITPGTIVGNLLTSVAKETGLARVPVVAPACHDSAAAVVAVPTREKDYVFLSCGTWSVLGTEVAQPLIQPGVPRTELWNEGGVEGKFRLTCNIAGLWLLQECRRIWASQGEVYTYDELTQMAAKGQQLTSLINPNAPQFMLPGDMPARIQKFCESTGQPVPETKADILRCILESLALKYRHGLKTIEAALGRKMKVVHMVGGGIQNKLLCKFTADATQLPVVAGPVEATATGNIIMQALAMGHISSVQEGRDLVRVSVPIETYEPSAPEAWEEAYERFLTYL